MQIVSSSLISGKKVLLRYDIDVQIVDGKVIEDFKLRAGLPTLKLCLENAKQVLLIGHLGRPEGKFVPELSVEPIRQWLKTHSHSSSGKLEVLENLRFDPREEACDLGFAKELADMGDIYINEGFGSYRPAVSTTVLPQLLPNAAGLRFAKEVEKLTEVRNNPKKPFIAILGGAKVTDKLPVITELSKKADAVLVGGKLVAEIREKNLSLPKNVMVGMVTRDGLDITPETVEAWRDLIMRAKMIIWNGPLGKIQSSIPRLVRLRSPQVRSGQEFQITNLGSAKGTYEVAKMILGSGTATVVGGGDTIAFLNSAGLLGEFEKKGFVSVGGGAMLKFLVEGTLPTIKALQS